MLDWTAEEKVLRNSRKIIIDAWRMNNRQLCDLYEKLQKNQDKILPGQLGLEFLDLFGRMAARRATTRWSDLMKDIECLQRQIHTHLEWEEQKWAQLLKKLEIQQNQYFNTDMGKIFVKALKNKLDTEAACKAASKGPNSPGEEAAGWIPGHKLPEEEVLEQVLEQDELEQYAQWLMQDEPDIVEKRKKRLVSSKFMERAAIAISACLSLCFFVLWLQGQVVRNLNKWNIKQMKIEAAQQADTQQDKENSKSDEDPLQQAENRKPDTQAASMQKEASAVENAEKTGVAQAVPVQNRAHQMKVLPQYKEMAKDYPELYGWLQIPGTQIDMPVMRPEKEREFYLHHDYTGAKSAEGTLFVDPQNSRYPKDDNTVIYGHNMKNGHIFGTLNQYENEDFFKAHTEIQFDTIYETGKYEAAAILKTRILNEEETGFRYYQCFHFDSQEEFQQCLDFIGQNQIYHTGCTFQYGDQILMLSTCEYSQENGRLVIVAKKIQ